MSAIQETRVEDHFNNWPNVQGFEANYEEKTPIELPVEGQIPAYAAGVLYRTGPGKYKVDTVNGETFRASHWFDGFSETHRFQLLAPDSTHPSVRVLYNSRFSTDALIEQVRQTGEMHKLSFGQKRDPCKVVYQKVQTEYEPEEKPTSTTANIGVTLSINMPGLADNYTNNHRWDTSSGIKTLHAKTDFNAFKQLDPETLEPITLASQQNLHPALKGPGTAAHARSDPKTGDIFNYNLEFGPVNTYRIFRTSASTGETTILATFPATPAYLHSLLITADFVVLCVWNAHISPADFGSTSTSFLDAIKPFDPSLPATWYVIDRTGERGLVATYTSRPFFCFHTINAWQETTQNGDTDIVAELVTFDTADFMHKLYYEYLLSDSPHAKPRTDETCSSVSRFRLPTIPSSSSSSNPEPQNPQEPSEALLESTSCKPFSPELPTMHPAYVTRKHRYMYAVADTGKSTLFDSIIKFDNESGETKVWSHHAQSPGEPIFVPNPDGVEGDGDEDDGVLLSVVLNGLTGKSYLLCLDARSLVELGRARVAGPVAFGFHGQYVPVRGLPTGDY
ncbi:dioxygenase, partial [Aspergillus costaricaensis CBS 115574]